MRDHDSPDELIELPLGHKPSWEEVDKGERRPAASSGGPPEPGRHRRRWPWLVSVLVVAAVAWFLTAPRVEFDTDVLAFPAQRVGELSEPQRVAVANGGWRALRIDAVAVAGPARQDFRTVSDECSGEQLSRGEECSVEVRYAPEAPGEHGAVLELSVGGFAGSAELGLAGRGIAPVLAARPATLDFGSESVGATSPGGDLELLNDGSDTLHIERVTVEGPEGEFRLVGNECSGVHLEPGESCRLRLVFKPRLLGRREGELAVASDAFGGKGAVPLIGRGSGPNLDIAPEGLDFGSQRVGSRSEPKTLTLTNRGEAAMRISRLRIAESPAFRLEREDCSDGALAVGGSCRAVVTFNPTGEGSARASLEIREASGGLAPGVGISGRGVSPRIELEPGAISFGGVRVGEESSPRRVVLSNGGTAKLSVAATRLVGEEAAAFTKLRDACGGTSLEPGERCEVELSFRPTVGGDAAARLEVRSDASGSAAAVDLAGHGRAPSLAIGRSRLDFAAVRQTENQDLRSEISNDGDAVLTMGRVSIGGSAATDFTLASDGCSSVSLEPGRSCWLVVRFSPLGEGPRDARLSIESDAPGGERSLVLRGVGLPAPEAGISVTPSQLAFGAQPVGERSEVLTVEVTSTGQGRLELERIRVEGVDAEDFRVVPGTCQGLPYVAPGGECTFGIRFVPGASGSRTARLAIASNAAAGGVTVSLRGEGL